ncbi:MAG: hypothetical protein RMK51_12945 [Meiothermus sp.]|uniref:hypothetical protein n=1 Tax=Meiothermus sp. TaxID=1955249 RepID=UPI0025FB3D08|nr:hypothetical protein [Meiothermus sp.]MCS7069574.1 hypothetical protein [Meiothermus sp.]MDW8426830.1 hypothetical protein [Meiothermus sp.]
MNEGLFKGILLLHFAATWFLVGLIWMVQVVHYPLFARVGSAEFVGYETAHASLISLLVGPLMLLELLTAIALVSLWPSSLPGWLGWLLLALLGAVWLTTLLVSVPLHARLAAGFDAEAHALLVGSNWIRTLAWTARGLLLGWVLYRTL